MRGLEEWPSCRFRPADRIRLIEPAANHRGYVYILNAGAVDDLTAGHVREQAPTRFPNSRRDWASLSPKRRCAFGRAPVIPLQFLPYLPSLWSCLVKEIRWFGNRIRGVDQEERFS